MFPYDKDTATCTNIYVQIKEKRLKNIVNKVNPLV
jgi:hypothetical protein